MIKVLLDTDIGSDIDDAVCLAYLLSQSECELLGITTVTGEAEKRAMLASVLCKVAGKDIPIYPGVEKPLLVPQMQPHAPQSKALENWGHEERFPKGQAIEFLRQTIRANPGEVVLLTIGPLTNIALLFGVDPEIPSLLKGLVSMCGVYTNRLAGVGPLEWNAVVDPHATAMVYQAPVPYHRLIGLDVTMQLVMETSQVIKNFRYPLLKPVLDFAEVWFKETDKIIFHDPLAGTTLFDNQICTFKKGNVEVELTSEKLHGFTYWHPDEAPSHHEVALEVDRERFFKHYFSVFEVNK